MSRKNDDGITEEAERDRQRYFRAYAKGRKFYEKWDIAQWRRYAPKVYEKFLKNYKRAKVKV